MQNEVAELFGIEPNEVNAVVTFYDMFFEEPVGKHVLHVCKNVSCMLRGGDEVMGNLCRKLNIKPGETTADGEFTVIPSECLAACDRAPMMLVDDKVIGPIKEEQIDQILADAKKGPGHPSPVEVAMAEMRILMANIDKPGQVGLVGYERNGGYQAIKKSDSSHCPSRPNGNGETVRVEGAGRSWILHWHEMGLYP